MRARTAVIPAAGLGTRFLPVTWAIPKELVPIVDVPAIQLVIDEAAGAGMEHVVVVSSADKPAVENYLRPLPGWVLDKVRESGRDELADRLARLGHEVRITVVLQDEPRGLGHAVGCARNAVGDEPFAVILPDEIMGSAALLSKMADVNATTASSTLGLLDVPHDQVHRYGVVTPGGPVIDGVLPVADVIEKPRPEDAPSDSIVIGRYVLTPDAFDEIAALRPGAGGELQLTDALRAQAARGPLHGVMCEVGRHDTGTPALWLQTVVDHGLAHPVLGPAFAAWLGERVARQ